MQAHSDFKSRHSGRVQAGLAITRPTPSDTED
jgi:hypothetical protein